MTAFGLDGWQPNSRLDPLDEPADWPAVSVPSGALLDLRWRLVTWAVQTGGHTLRHGRVAWESSFYEIRTGIAWDWVEVEPEVFAIGNPLAIQTNIELGTAAGDASSSRSLLHSLHVIVHGLPWQGALLEELKRLKGS